MAFAESTELMRRLTCRPRIDLFAIKIGSAERRRRIGAGG
jgi:hypothetical protein